MATTARHRTDKASAREGLVRWFVGWLLSNPILSAHHFAEPVMFIWINPFFATRRSLVARREELTGILLPDVECLLLSAM